MAVAVIGPVALLTVWVVTASAPPVALDHDPTPVWVSAEQVALDRAEKGLLELAWTQEQPLTYRGPGGVVTAVALSPGLELTNGLPALEVDGRSIRVLQADKPLVAPVGPRSSAEELHVVVEFLTAAGYPVEGTGWSRDLAVAIEGYGREVLGVRGASAFDPSWTVWSPRTAGVVAEVTVTPGADAPTPGTVIGALKPFLAAARLSTTALDALKPGRYVVALYDEEFVLLEDGTVDPSRLADLARTVDETPTTLEVSLRPETAGTAISVPAGAVIVDGGGLACVATGADPTAPDFAEVVVVGGIPGAAYLENDEMLVHADVLANPIEVGVHGPCR
ncbi:hypothetical protein [Cellulomonas carbonis]|uniref:Peptidoglycan-binding protein n=1 Tax=Cellulomonas carbonis T26 TaxID=947969 RepID=A0A0A0BTA8_9CELL|nr:hypothetical protein [Cellulomonas carbonis]KGM10394.1 hypothetical protein N868_15545 [Cellulomonas carbonis T26]GGB99890.1 hypothetical protein GCM10010972_10820 [Cellulomonas carbonis]